MRETVPITAEWALWGRYAGGSGYEPRELYRLLECSDGPVRREAFEQALLRYSPGKLEDRPQVTVSWLPVQAGQSYMAIAIHARPEIGWGDAAGRESTVTRYYCAPFSDLAAGTVSYQAMYEGFQRIKLPPGNRAPIQTRLSASRPGTPRRGLAIRVAALLLTSRPVRVTGAEGADLGERLRFLDDVASLLPYGMRSRLSAATWVNSIFREHNLRLIFSNPSRERTDELEVLWGRDDVALTGYRIADEYVSWLRTDVSRRVAWLAEQTEPMGFSEPGVLRWLRDTLGRDEEVSALTTRLSARFSGVQRDLGIVTNRLESLAALLAGHVPDAGLGREVERVIEAARNADFRYAFDDHIVGPAPDIRALTAATDELAGLVRRASTLVEDVEVAALARYDADRRGLIEARRRLEALTALLAEKGSADDLMYAAERLGVNLDETIRGSRVFGERLTQPVPDVQALRAATEQMTNLASLATQVLDSASAELSRFWFSLSYAKVICVGFSTTFLVQIYPPRRQQAAARRVKKVFGETGIEQVAQEARLQHGMKLRIRLSSPAMDFPEPVQKLVSLAGSDIAFSGKPKESTIPGVHAGVLAVSDQNENQELLSIPFQLNIVDYAFDHVSRPVVGRITGGLVGALSVSVLALALITRTEQVLGAAGGATGLALSAFIFGRINNLYQSRTVTVQETRDLPVQ